ncbi:MAG: PAS domain S-box protein [Undibacterium sp.]|nr:PAS domain S-box protein [Opitutaceae bacterium]
MKKARRLPSTAPSTPLSRLGSGFPIVGIGASAGGLEAFTQLLKRLPVDTGLGFVLVQHLDPHHSSALAEILAGATAMPVHEVTNNLRVAANHVYVIPPDKGLGILKGVLKLRPRALPRGAPRSIDFFFEALALDQRERAIGVILSGNATDGTLGLEAIRAEGGITFAQDDSAGYNSMPRSAVSAGCVDFVLSPDAIANELTRVARHLARSDGAPAREAAPPARGGEAAAVSAERSGKTDYEKILLLLQGHTGVDFSLYKARTIHRRIMRRTVLNRHATLESYADFLRGNVKELDALYSDALIGVTNFFRNAEAFRVLQRKVFSELLRRGDAEPVRVWVLGCSTGQEAYSIAMAFAECAEMVPGARRLQVFATDLNDANLEKARHGHYPKSLARDISPERLRRFFAEEDDGYRVNKALRDLVVFARQNFIGDPPFSRMDLISCRNLMIYFEPSLQRKALPTFHYALKPEGFLFLGASESIGSFTDLFKPVDKKQKIYARKAAPVRAFQLPLPKPRGDRAVPEPAPGRRALTGRKPRGKAGDDIFNGELSPEREADRVTVNQFAPPGVLINADLQILQFRGLTGAYLEPPNGKASFDLLKMVHEGLALPLRAALRLAKGEHRTVRKENVALKQQGIVRLVHFDVVPLKNLKERCYLVVFEEAEKARRVAAGEARAESPQLDRRAEESSRVVDLERDLADTRDYLQSVEEQREASHKELQASIEEAQSANEEFQSLNEELETSKEELESTNEELTTVNEEMASRNIELSRVNSDLTNFQASTKLVIVLLGRDLTLRRFSPQAGKQFRLAAADIGRPFRNVRHQLEVPALASSIAEVIASDREREHEVRDREGRWYSLRISPYLTAEKTVDGAVLVLVDINALKETEAAVIHARDFAEAIIDTARDPFLILDAAFCVQKANPAFFTAFKIASAGIVGRTLFELEHGQWDLPELRQLLRDVLPLNTPFNDFEVAHRFKKIGRRTLLLHARPLSQQTGHREKILLGFQDVTDLLTIQARFRQSELRYRRLFETAQDGILMLDPATRKITEANPYILNMLGYSHEQLLTKELWEIGLLKDEAANRKAFRELKAKGFVRYENLPLESKTGRRHEVEFVSNLYIEDGLEVIQCNIRDITERMGVAAALRANEWRLRYATDSARLTYIEADLVRGGARAAANFAAVMGYAPPPGQETDVMAGTGVQLARVVPADRGRVEAALEAFTGGQAVGKIEYRVLGDDGIERWIESRWSVELGRARQRLKSFATNLDITERKRADAALRESEARFRAAVGIVSSVVWTNNAHGFMGGEQPGWAHFTGQTQAEYQGYGWAKAVHPDDQQPTVAAWEQAVAQKRLFEFEHRLLRRDGKWRLCSIRAVPLLTDDGALLEWVGVHTDITERKESEAALHASETFSRSIIESSPDCIKILDLDGNLRSLLRGQEMLEIEDLPLFLNKSWLKFWRGADRVAAGAAIATAAAGGEGNFVGFFRPLRGEPKWWDVSISPLPGRAGQPARLLAVSRDVTHRRRTELNLSLLAAVSQDLAHPTGVEKMIRTISAKMGAHFGLSACAFVTINETACEHVVTHDWHRKDVPGLIGVYRQDDFLKEEFLRLARAGETIVVRDTATDPRTAPERFAALKIAAFICVPLVRDGQWRFALCLYHSAAHAWREDEIELARELTARIWTRLQRLRVLAELGESEARYRTLFNSMDEGYCVLEMIFDQKQKPVDWLFLDVNPSFKKQTGMADVKGKRICDLVPNLDEYWFETYGNVVRTGKPIRFVNEAKPLGRWFDLYAFRVGGAGSRKVAVLFSDISARKRTEASLDAARIQLSDHAATLGKIVGLRTAELTATNGRLENSIATVTKGREEYRSLLLESEFMQKKLRHLARQILSAQEDERRKISRDLHDDVVQILVGINVELSAMGRDVSLGPRALQSKIKRTQRLVKKSVTAVHQFARELRPAVLDDLGLIPALHAFMKTAAARSKFKIRFTAFAGVEDLDSARRTVLYRVAQEALTNVGRHAQAREVTVDITQIPGAIRMEVHDNGKSFQVPQTLSSSTNKRLGLLGMRERVEMVGGTVVIKSEPGRGTTVRAEIPFHPKDPS